MVWSKPHNFVVIDLTSPKHNEKYRSGFDSFFIVEQMNTELLEKMREILLRKLQLRLWFQIIRQK